MPSKKITAMTDLAGAQVPTDLFTVVDLSELLPADQNKKSTLNDIFAEITKNITDLTVQFGDGVTGTVSAAGKGKLRYNNTAGSFQVSENGGAYQNLVKGSGTATRVAFWSAADELSSNSDLYWDNVNERLGIGVGSTPDGPLDVLADGTALAQQWRQNAGPLRVQMILDNVPEGSLGTTTNHTFHLLSNNLQRLTVENGGLIGINKAAAVQAQLQVVSQDATTETLILNSAASPSVNIAEFYNDSSLRFAFSPAANLAIGLSGAGGATGSITFNGVTSGAVTVNVAAAAGTWTLTLPTTDGNAGQFLQTDGSGVTTWATATTSPASPVNSVQFNNAGSFGGSSNLLWDDSNNRLLLGVSVASGQAPLDVLADGTALAQQWRQNGGSLRVQMILDNVPEGSLGTTTNHTFHLLSNNLQRLTVENGGLIGINKTAAVQAQLQVVSQDATTETLILNSAASPSANIAEFYNDSSLRFAFSPAANLAIGLSGAGGATGSITFNGVTSGAVTMNVAAAAGTWTLTLPTTDGNAGEFLQTDGNGVTTWATAGGSPGGSNTQVQYNNAGAFGGISGFTSDGTNVTAASGNLRATSPRITTGINDANGNEAILLTATASAVNEWTATNAATGGTVTLAATGDDANIPINIWAKGTAAAAIAKFGTTGGWQLQVSNSIGIRFATNDAGTTNYFQVTAGWARIAAGMGFSITNSVNDAGGTQDVFLMREGAANWRLGGAAAASPVAQTLSVQNVVAGTSNTAGVNWTFNGSRGTGTGAGGALVWQVAPAGSSGTAQNALSSTMRLDSTQYLAVYTGTAPNVWTSGTRKAQLYLLADSLPSTGVVAYFSGTAADGPIWHLLRGRGTNASPTAVQNGDRLGTIEFAGHTSTGTNDFAIGGDIAVSATEAWSAGNNGSRMIFRVAPNAGTVTERMSLENSGTLRVGATSGSFNTTTLVQVGNYASWNTDVVAAIYTGANGNKGLEIIGTNGATASPLRIYRDALTPDLLNLAASGVLSLRAGLNTGTLTARVGGTIHQDTTAVSNSGTGETDLMTFSLPANTLGTDEDYLLLDFSGEFVSPTGNSRLRVYFGSTVIFDTTALAFTTGTWRFQAKVTRTTGTDQVAVTTFSGDTALVTVTAQTAAPTATLSGAVTIKVTGQGAASDEIFQTDSKIQWWPAAA